MKPEPFLIPCTKMPSKWIKDLNVRPKTIKFLEDIISKTLFDINHCTNSVDLSPKAKEINKWEFSLTN